MLRILALAVLRFAALPIAALPTSAQQAVPKNDTPITLQEIMADPAWMGRFPKRAYWAPNSKTVYYFRTNPHDDEPDLHSIELENRTARRINEWDRGSASAPRGVYDRARKRRLEVRNDDLFLLDLESNTEIQLTRTSAREASPQFLLDGDRISFRRDRRPFIRNLATGLESEAAIFKFEEDPAAEEPTLDHLEEQQARLFDVLKTRKERRELASEREHSSRDMDSTRVPQPWYLEPGDRQSGFSLSPDGTRLFLRTAKDTPSSEQVDQMPKFVTESSWVESVDVRPHVGLANPWSERLMVLDIETRERVDLDLSALPGIFNKHQPWREASETESADENPTPKPVYVIENRWSPDGKELVIMLRSLDNKDRWLARLDQATGAVQPIHHLHDEAWIGWRFNELGWFKNSSGIWFTSEESGYSQLYCWTIEDNSVRPMTSGSFEIDQVELSPDGTALYFRANHKDPGIHEVCRFPLPDGPFEALTDLGGRTSGKLSPDGSMLLLTSSTALAPPELFLQAAEVGATAKQLTDSQSPDFKARSWVEPQFIRIPSENGPDIHARLYEPTEASDTPRPVVAFVHGSGYLQNAHRGWSGYFREFMFHSFLVQAGYVVIDIDYRASAGYGRDWRTAIYRQMGKPELDDYFDALDWLVTNRSVDYERIGIYGGSYGGFLALMALFKQPGAFACGAALRPVTDWSHYNHGYTSNILNTPQDDPEAYRLSSPIEFAADLEDPLLICHGMLDDNVLVKDSIRLAQRLIELEKENFELALYPVEGHAFREPSSWLDEYRRIFKLFETHLK